MSDERPGDGGDQPDWPDTLVVPDDPSGLRADEIALRRERAALRRRARWYRFTGGSRLRAYGVSVPVVLVAVLAVAGFGALLVLLGPHPSPDPPTAATVAPTEPAGRPGGRLPSAMLMLPSGASVLAPTLVGPAAVLLVPTGCDCTETLSAAEAHAFEASLKVYVVEPTAALAATVADPDRRELAAYADPTGRLLQTYGATGSAPTLLLLDGEGAVRTVTTGLAAAQAATAFVGAGS